MAKTKIEWATDSWNPVTGCTKCSEGCVNCYAERQARRMRGRFGYPEDEPFRVTEHRDKAGEPYTWRKPRRVFVCSMGDLFHKDVDPRYRQLIFSVMLSPSNEHHTFLVLTKRPERMRGFISQLPPSDWNRQIPPNHIFLGVSAENQRRADQRIPILTQIPARRFVSFEPLLGGIDARMYLDAIHWAIVGPETGPGARVAKAHWARTLRLQCLDRNVPFFLKKASPEWGPESQDLMVREWPEGL